MTSFNSASKFCGTVKLISKFKIKNESINGKAAQHCFFQCPETRRENHTGRWDVSVAQSCRRWLSLPRGLRPTGRRHLNKTKDRPRKVCGLSSRQGNR